MTAHDHLKTAKDLMLGGRRDFQEIQAHALIGILEHLIETPVPELPVYDEHPKMADPIEVTMNLDGQPFAEAKAVEEHNQHADRISHRRVAGIKAIEILRSLVALSGQGAIPPSRAIWTEARDLLRDLDLPKPAKPMTPGERLGFEYAQTLMSGSGPTFVPFVPKDFDELYGEPGNAFCRGVVVGLREGSKLSDAVIKKHLDEILKKTETDEEGDQK